MNTWFYDLEFSSKLYCVLALNKTKYKLSNKSLYLI